MLMRKPKYKVFDYEPRYYDPSKDPEERKKQRLSFSRDRKTRRKKTSTYMLLILLLIILYFFVKLGS